jgi:hypothetical protein
MRMVKSQFPAKDIRVIARSGSFSMDTVSAAGEVEHARRMKLIHLGHFRDADDHGLPRNQATLKVRTTKCAPSIRRAADLLKPIGSRRTTPTRCGLPAPLTLDTAPRGSDDRTAAAYVATLQRYARRRIGDALSSGSERPQLSVATPPRLRPTYSHTDAFRLTFASYGGGICDITLSVLYILLKPVNRNLALLSAFFESSR